MPFKKGRAIRGRGFEPRVEPDPEEVDYETLVRDTADAILFTFEVIDRKHDKTLVDVWLPKKLIEVDEERKLVKMPKWLYEKQFGHQYKG